MVTYVILGSYTEQGIRNIKQLPQLRQAAEQFVAGKGGRVAANYHRGRVCGWGARIRTWTLRSKV